MIVTWPPATPVTFPVLSTVAADELLLHVAVPPDGLRLRLLVLLRVIIEPTHTWIGPVIGPATGCGITVTVADAVADPQVAVETE